MWHHIPTFATLRVCHSRRSLSPSTTFGQSASWSIPLYLPSFKQTSVVQTVYLPYAPNNFSYVSRDAPRTTCPIDLMLCVPPALPSLKISSVVDPIHSHPYGRPRPNSFQHGHTSWDQGRPSSFARFLSGSCIYLLANVLPRACPLFMSLCDFNTYQAYQATFWPLESVFLSVKYLRRWHL